MAKDEQNSSRNSETLIGEILEASRDETDGRYYFDRDFGREKNRKTVESGFWKKVQKTAQRIPFTEDLIAAYYCALDNNTPMRVRGILLAALAYFILPIDSIPDFLLGFGFTDDIAVLTVAITTVKKHMKDTHYLLARKALHGEESEKQG